MADRNVGHRAIVQLWARAGGMCSHPDCKMRLILEASGKDQAAFIGEVAHIIAASPKGPRGRKAAPKDRNSIDNLILLCRNHHKEVDEHHDRHPVEVLSAWKEQHEAWVATATTITPGTWQWTAIVQESGARIDVQEAQTALGPGHRVVTVAQLCSSPEKDGWRAAASAEREAIAPLLENTPIERRRFAIFSLGRIPLAVQLGFLLSDRSRVELFQYHRHEQTWAWPPNADHAAEPTIGGATVRERSMAPLATKSDEDLVSGHGFSRAVPSPAPLGFSPCASSTEPSCHGTPAPPQLRITEGGRTKGEAAIRVSLSAPVTREQARCDAEWDIEIAIPEPHKLWLRSPAQLTALAIVYEQALSLLRDRQCRRIHLFYAGPAPGAIAFGRAYNASMNPPLQLYEFRAAADPPYDPVLELNGA